MGRTGFRTPKARWRRLIGAVVMVMTPALMHAADRTIWIQSEPDAISTIDRTEVSSVLADEISSAAPAVPTASKSTRLVEPTSLQPQTFAGEVVDPTAGASMMQQGSNTAATSIQAGGLGSGSVFAGPQGFGGNLTTQSSGLFNSVSSGIFSNPSQTVYNGGTTLKLLEGESWAFMTRGLFGFVDNYAISDTSFTYSIDSYFGTRVRSYGGGEHWVKFGGFVDDQNQFGKAGPMVGALLFANEAFPVTVDAAVGFGYGNPIDRLPSFRETVDVANRDYQIRVGTFLSPTMQVGITTMIADFTGPGDNRSWSVGGFTNFLVFNRTFVRLDMSAGDEGLRGFALLSYLFGPSPMRNQSCGDCRGECRVDGKSWLLQPVNRDVALQLRTREFNVVDRLAVQARVVSPPRQAIGIADGSGIVKSGQTFELDIIATNTTSVNIVSVGIGQNPTTSGTAGSSTQGISGGNFANVPPGATVQTDQSSDINVDVSAGAAPGSTIFITCDVTAEGKTRRVTFGPIIVGTTTNGTTYSAN
jgi:hypothetical protein